ncbi:MAG: hypothetical protein EAZ74_04055 [Alphaproteobacteria bacterium]|nr:MAG: hypothetical protein EAY76_04050 [Alphaproteobacteria bacterium]TAF14411.1 MAG: hypothetical protein EAZ74_04055 [Alphaproteobacteria bacterium]TAF39572.1 MAG: hypothetical protein EAZ66_04605 [Alphaproteobacteria bacterium]TAF77555.1 MAG: hypothetical protein EAZ52_00185 [Alphaproteobacteria bacterium]
MDKHLKRLQEHVPKAGSVRALQVTDRQYGRMQILVGTKRNNEKNAPEQLSLF